MPTMKDVAKAARVSLATVSATLSGAAYVSPELRRRVLEAVDALGYAPNSVASGLKRGKTSLLGLIVPDITNPFFTELVHHVQLAARGAGYSVLLGVSDQDVVREGELLRLMRSHQAAGTILCGTGAAGDYETLSRDVGQMRLVMVDNAPAGIGVDTIVLDNGEAAALATRHILSFGHRLVATVAGPEHQVPGRERLEGFLATMAAESLAAPADLVRRGAFRQEDAFDAGCELLSLHSRPTAIFVANNHMLVGVMQAVAAAGLSVPRDISVAGIDDFPWAIAFTPTLTTVRQPIAAMAETALTRLMARIGGERGEPQRQVMAPELIVRNSCAPPARDARSDLEADARRIDFPLQR
ncbi:MAG TPA: LacI family DNA-binding transcriptional regulator [Mesorhizobium sp.]|jgi:LacI family transcriptional regulator|nr:LacI family DNA-binding transcriptional regulator [Mesorhizobium sp.]